VRTFRVGTRGSKLAAAQARLAVAALEEADPGASFEFVPIRTAGDRSASRGFPFGPGVGVFVREIERALFEGGIDLAVHSLKDVPTATPPGLVIAAVTEREDARDALVARGGETLDDLPPGSRVGTSSARRKAQLLHARRDLEVVPIRGNVDTRLRKLDEGWEEVSAVILAAAGLARLGLGERATELLPLDRFPTAAGQGALAVEARADDTRALVVARGIEHAATRSACEAERAFIEGLGAGCRAAVGASAAVSEGGLALTGSVLSEDGTIEIRGEELGELREARSVGEDLARRLSQDGALELIAAAREHVR
jgi:hydroxymethylbilane synthase